MYNHKSIAKVSAALVLLIIEVLLASDARAAFSATPINDLGTGNYLGFQGGLYPGGSNNMPAAHAATGVQRANLIEPLDSQGNPDPDGKIVFLSIGMSNAKQEFCGQTGDAIDCDPWSFAGQAASDPDVNHDTLVMVNGAMGGRMAPEWVSPNDDAYDAVQSRSLEPNGLTEAQVQVVWLKNATGGPDVALPSPQADAYDLLENFGDTVRALKIRYPNLQQVYVSSRIYAGYSTSGLNPEPYAYESGFAVKWLIEAQINQMATGAINPIAGNLNYNSVAPWIAWGPYTWANGMNPRSDGLTWKPADFDPDLTHPSQSGETKVGGMLLDFFEHSAQSQPWFTNGQNNDAPTAIIEATPLQGLAPLQVSFDGSSSSDDGQIVSYQWNFGDSGTSTKIAPQHTYLNPGDYTATLTVVDDDGNSDTASVEIRVTSEEGCRDHCSRVSAIDFDSDRKGRGYRVVALLTVTDETGAALPDALVSVTWTLPDGSTLTRQAYTGADGVAYPVAQGSTGTYSLEVNEITIDGYTFDLDNSVLTGTVIVQ